MKMRWRLFEDFSRIDLHPVISSFLLFCCNSVKNELHWVRVGKLLIIYIDLCGCVPYLYHYLNHKIFLFSCLVCTLLMKLQVCFSSHLIKLEDCIYLTLVSIYIYAYDTNVIIVKHNWLDQHCQPQQHEEVASYCWGQSWESCTRKSFEIALN